MRKAFTFSALALACNATCPNIYKVDEKYVTCQQLEGKFGISREELHRLNDDLDCEYFFPQEKEVCISNEAHKPCERFYSIDEYTDCNKIEEVYQVSRSELINMNVNLSCTEAKLAKDRKICVSQQDMKPCKQLYTPQRKKTNKYDQSSIYVGCNLIWEEFGLTKTDLIRINKHLKCLDMKRFCLSVEEPKPCTHIYKVYEYTKMTEIANTFELKQQELNRMNVGLNFSEYYKGDWAKTTLGYKNLEKGTEVCVSQSEPKACPFTYTVGTYESCSAIKERWGMSIQKLHTLNSGLDCSKDLAQGQKVCVTHELLDDCTKKYRVFEYKTCSEVESTFEIKHQEFVKLNPGLDCTKELPKSRTVCVRGPKAVSQ